jgi:tRNA-splicing ligase RtcB (3'-phosphate/5'-hydroxy nucleic acid ligase)
VELKKISKPHKIYAEVLESEALDQFVSAMDQPFAVQGALMPDSHAGYALPIGAVVATKDVVVPSWVGYDIGCGMCALKLDGQIDSDAVETNAKEIFDLIYKTIPVGFNINQTHTPYSLEGLTEKGREIAEERKYSQALGSLGGGNHFIEIGIGTTGEVWVVIHSGSRGVGHALATYYMKAAHPENKAKDGHWGFHKDEELYHNYMQDQAWALDFAIANRKEMMERVIDAITTVLDISCYEADMSNLINRNHNHAEIRDGLIIHRKGATHAEDGMMGVIPGNMRDGSFIVQGKGNPDSLYSSSHGAGRVLSRKKAKEVVNLDSFIKEMDGIVAMVTEKTKDESPFAYKNIFDVMKLQEDLVSVVDYIIPTINIKG